MIDKMNELEKAAIEAAEDCYECAYDDNHSGMKIIKEAFICGAEWMRMRIESESYKSDNKNNV